MIDLYPFKDFGILFLVKNQKQFRTLHAKYNFPQWWWYTEDEVVPETLESISIIDQWGKPNDYLIFVMPGYKYTYSVEAADFKKRKRIVL